MGIPGRRHEIILGSAGPGGTRVPPQSAATATGEVSDLAAHVPAPVGLLERERELEAIDALLARARAGEGAMLFVEGAPGLGKSRLLSEAGDRARRRGMRVLTAVGSEAEQPFPFGVVLQLLESTVKRMDGLKRRRLFGGAAAAARPLLEAGTVEAGRGEATSVLPVLHGLYWLMSNLAEDGPSLICVDDMHWCDDVSLRFLRYLVARVAEIPLAIVGGSRPTDADAVSELQRQPAVRSVDLHPLSRRAVRKIVAAVSGPAVSEDLVNACAEVTMGNPFYLRELLLALEGNGEQDGRDTAEMVRRLEVSSVARSVFFRVSSLGAGAGRIARAAAVLGGRGSLRHAAALAELDDAAAATLVDSMVALRVLAPGEELVFSHPLVQAAVYGDIPPRERGEAHLRAAGLLADESALPGRVAVHLLRAPAAADARTVAILREAAAQARAQGANEDAARFLSRALAEPPHDENRVGVLTELAEAEVAAGLEPAELHLREALGVAPGGGERARVGQLLGRLLHGRGRSLEAALQYEDALAELGPGADGEMVTAILADYLVAGLFDARTRPRVRALIDQSREPAVGATAADRALLAHLALMVAQDAGPAERTERLALRGWSDGELLEDTGAEGRSWLICLWALMLAERYEAAERIATSAVDEATRRGSPTAFATASYSRGDIRLRLGRLDEAAADLENAVGQRGSGWMEYLTPALARLGEIRAERGEFEAAAALIDEAERSASGQVLFDGAMVIMARARLAVAQDAPAEGLAAAVEAGEMIAGGLGAEWTVMSWRALAAAAAAQLGDHKRARDLIELELAHADRVGAPVSRGRALRVLGMVDGSERQELLRQAVAVLEDTSARLELAHALVDLGSAMRRGGQRGDARAPLRRGAELARACGASMLATRAGIELAATGARLRWERSSGVDSLTPSERRVGELAARGRTNREIAQSLFVSQKTVEFQLRHVYQKLHIGSRDGLNDLLASTAG